MSVENGQCSIDHALISGAAAEIARQCVAHRRFVDRLAVQITLQLDQCHDDAGRAVSALQAMMLGQRHLNGVELFTRFGDAFDRFHRVPIGLRGQEQTGANGCSVEQHRAGATDAVLAADMRARQANLMPQHVRQMRPRFNGDVVFRAIDAHRDGVAIRHAFYFQPE